MSSDVSAMAHLNMARKYHEAADELFTVSEQRPKIHGQRQLSDPINFLYFHAIELALKAFLHFHDQKLPTSGRASHDITALYARCRKMGLVISPDDRLTIGNIVSLLSSGNKKDGFRYFNLESGTTADLEWTSEVVATLMDVITSIVKAIEPPRLAKIMLVVHKPIDRKIAADDDVGARGTNQRPAEA